MFHVSGFWSLAGAAVTGLVLADVLYHWQASTRLASTGSSFITRESSLLAGRG